MFRSLIPQEIKVSQLTLVELRSDSRGHKECLVDFTMTDDRKMVWVPGELLEKFLKSFQERANMRPAKEDDDKPKMNPPEEMAVTRASPPEEVDVPQPNRRVEAEVPKANPSVKVEVPEPDVEENDDDAPEDEAPGNLGEEEVQENSPEEEAQPNPLEEEKAQENPPEEEAQLNPPLEEAQHNPPEEEEVQKNALRESRGRKKMVRFQVKVRSKSRERPAEDENSNINARKGVVTRSRSKVEKIQLLQGLNMLSSSRK